jgi:hypothetical protein
MIRIVCAATIVALLSSPALAATQPSKSACAAAWNQSAGASLRASIAARHPKGAFVDIATVGTVQWVIGGKTQSSSRFGCGIQFILHSGRTLAVSGAWNGNAVPAWSGPVASNRPISLPLNTAVHADGTVAFRG